VEEVDPTTTKEVHQVVEDLGDCLVEVDEVVTKIAAQEGAVVAD